MGYANCLSHAKINNCSKVFVKLWLLVTLLPVSLNAQEELNALETSSPNSPVWKQFKDGENQFYDYLTRLAIRQLDERANKVDSIKSLDAWKRRQNEVKIKLRDLIGPFPKRTPLNVKITKTIKKREYTVEHIVFESVPGYRVTSSLYLPSSGKIKKAPTIIYCSGHTSLGYRYKKFQYTILNLVKKGFVVFAFDPIGQGERLQYYDAEKKKSKIGGPTKEHSYPGTQAFIIGSSITKHMVWDGIRAIDYLFTRKEVDTTRIGITGISGGGTQSVYISAIDERIYALAPECYITNFRRIFQSIGPQDAEQNLLHQLYHGLDHPDYLLAHSPKPLRMLTTTNDFFSIQGAMETEEEVSRIYKAFGKPENFDRVEDLATHKGTKKNREAMYAFFQKHLDNPGLSEDEEVDFLTEEQLQVTPTGQLASSLGSETVYSLNKENALKLEERLNTSRLNLDAHIPKVITSAKKISGYTEPDEIGENVFTGKTQKDGFAIERYFLETPEGYIVPYVIYAPDKPRKKTVLYLHPEGKFTDSIATREIEWFIRQGCSVMVPDLLGTGETYPKDYRGDAYFERSTSYNIWYASILINMSIVGIRARDVTRLIAILKDKWDISEVSAIARNEMAPILLHAAALNESIDKIALIQPYVSYLSIAKNQFYAVKFIHNVVPGAVTQYDLPDLAATLVPRNLLVINPVDGSGDMLSGESLDNEFSIINSSYQTKGFGHKLTIKGGMKENEIYSSFTNWLND